MDTGQCQRNAARSGSLIGRPNSNGQLGLTANRGTCHWGLVSVSVRQDRQTDGRKEGHGKNGDSEIREPVAVRVYSVLRTRSNQPKCQKQAINQFIKQASKQAGNRPRRQSVSTGLLFFFFEFFLFSFFAPLNVSLLHDDQER